MAKIELNDRIELSDIFADCTHAGTSQFFTDNESLSFIIDPNDILPPRFTNLTDYPLYVIGINQESNLEYQIPYVNNTTYAYGSDWLEGYYNIKIVQLTKKLSNGTYNININSSKKFYDLTKKPIYWNRSPFQFMTYVNSGSFEMGMNINQNGYASTYNNSPRQYITIKKPFYIQRTKLTIAFFKAFDNRLDTTGDTVGKFDTRVLQCGLLGNTPNYTLNHVVDRIYTDSGCFRSGSGTAAEYWTDQLSSIGLSTTSLNNNYLYLVNSFGKNSSGTITTTTNNSFINNHLSYSASLDNSLCTLSGSGWVWDIPTDCQWEYACRAGTSTQFSNGVNLNKPMPTTIKTSGVDNETRVSDADTNDVCWCYSSIGDNSIYKYLGLLKPNKLGLYDMHGTIFERVKDSGPAYNDYGNFNLEYAGSPYYSGYSSTVFVNRAGQDGGSSYLLQRACKSDFRVLSTSITTLYYSTRLTIVQP